MTEFVSRRWEIEVPGNPMKRRNKATARINKSTVDAMPTPPTGGRTMLWDSEVKGFGVRIAASGVRTYLLRYRMARRGTPQRTVTIGQHGSPWTTEQARKRAIELLAQVRLGVDHVADRDAAIAAAFADLDARSERMFATFADT